MGGEGVGGERGKRKCHCGSTKVQSMVDYQRLPIRFQVYPVHILQFALLPEAACLLNYMLMQCVFRLIMAYL